MTINDALFSSASDNWSTPQSLFDELNNEFHFTLDACASKDNAKCENYFDEEMDALKQVWTGNVFMNPPYSKKLKTKYGQIDFVKKAYESVFVDKTADVVVCLIPARPDTKLWHTYVWDKVNHRPRDGVQVRFIEGRLHFGNSKNSAPFPSCCLVYKKEICTN